MTPDPVAAALRDRRIQCRVSQQRLGDLAGYSQPAISAWETGRNTMTTTEALALAEVLDCDIAVLGRERYLREWRAQQATLSR